MKKIIRLTESDLTRLVKRVINEDDDEKKNFYRFGYLVSNSYLQALFDLEENELAKVFRNPRLVKSKT